MNPDEPSHAAPFDVGDTVTVHGLVAFHNSAGGTGTLQLSKRDTMLCRITQSFWDYECGWRYHATPVADGDVERIRQAGTSNFGPDWYRANRPGDEAGLANAEKALAAFNPRQVFISEHDARKASPAAAIHA